MSYRIHLERWHLPYPLTVLWWQQCTKTSTIMAIHKARELTIPLVTRKLCTKIGFLQTFFNRDIHFPHIFTHIKSCPFFIVRKKQTYYHLIFTKSPYTNSILTWYVIQIDFIFFLININSWFSILNTLSCVPFGDMSMPIRKWIYSINRKGTCK